MQAPKATQEDTLDLETALAQQPSTSAVREATHSDPESRPKSKARSRFSSAIRKLSRKKQVSSQEIPQETVISSGGEEPDSAPTSPKEVKLKKKGSLSKRFLLASLSKKSKISPKTSIDADEDNEERTTAIDAFLDAEQEKQTERSVDDTAKKGAKPKLLSSVGRQSKVQITISGKKVAENPKTELQPKSSGTTTSEATATGKQIKESPSDLTAKALSNAEAAAKAKKKLKPKAITKAPSISGSSTKKTKPEETTEKLVVTQSTRDTPPSERAPFKPTRSASVSSNTATSNETPTLVRKSTTRAAATLTSPSLGQRVIGSSVKAKKPRANTLATGEAESMQDSSGTALQRGHRFPRPTAAAPTTATTLPLSPTEGKQQLQFQNNSETQSKPFTVQSARQQPPVLTISPTLTAPSLVKSQQQSNSGFTRNDSVKTENSGKQDDIPSSAESAAYQAGDEARPISQDLSDVVAEAALRLAARSLRKQGTVLSHESNLSSSSESRASNPRLHHISDPIMFDFESSKKSNDNFSLQTEATEHFYEKDNEVSESQMSIMDGEMEPVILTSTNGKRREHLYKILVIGELGTGKTSIIKRYVHQFFSQNYRATIGVDFALKVLHWDGDTIVRLQLWDIAGQERFGNMTRVYYKEAVGAFVVFDVTRSGTFECVSKWKEDLDSKVQLPDGSPIPCILLANKCDQEKQGIATQSKKIDDYVEKNGYVGWFETSAKENINIDEAANALVTRILLNDKLLTDSGVVDSDKLNLMLSDQLDAEAKSKCGC